MKTAKLYLLSILAVFTYSRNGFGEGATNPFAGSTVVPSAAATANANGVSFQSADAVQNDLPQATQSGREVKAADAANQGGSGAGAAAAAGAALTAAGTAQLLLGNFPEAATLFGMAGMEFGQAGADSGSQQANQNQANTLTANADGGTGATFNPAATAQSLMTPQTQQALQQAGIDPSSFLNNLTNGNIQSGTSALSALGQDPSSLSPDDLSAMNDFGSVNLGSIPGMPEGLGNQSNLSLASDDSARPNAGSGGSMPIVMGGSSGGTSTSLQQPTHNSASTALGSFPSSAAPVTATAPPAQAGSKGNVLDPQALMLQGLAALQSPEKEGAADEATMDRATLKSIGVAKGVRGGNIFHVANRNFRSFSKWRSTRVANNKG